MEGKAMLFKQFANVDAFPICLDTQDTDAIADCVPDPSREAVIPGALNERVAYAVAAAVEAAAR